MSQEGGKDARLIGPQTNQVTLKDCRLISQLPYDVAMGDTLKVQRATCKKKVSGSDYPASQLRICRVESLNGRQIDTKVTIEVAHVDQWHALPATSRLLEHAVYQSANG